MAVGDDYHPHAGEHAAPIPEGQTRRNYDWPALKKLYVEGVKDPKTGIIEWLSLDSVAKMHAVSANRVREVSARDGWVRERDTWRAEVEVARRKARANALAQTATNVEGKATESAQLGLQLVAARLKEVGTLQAARQSQGAAALVDGPVIDALEMTRLGQAADLFHKLALRALGVGETEGRLEVSGPGGGPIEITQELQRDDPNRIATVLAILERAQLGSVLEPVLDVEVLDPAGDVRGD